MPESSGIPREGHGIRVRVGDRVRHIDMREGIVKKVLSNGDVVVDLEIGHTDISMEGFWEKIHRNKVTP